MERRKRIGFFISIFLLLPVVLLLAAGEQEEKTGTVSMKMWKAGTDEVSREFWLNLIGEYETLNQGVSIEFADAPWGGDIDTKLNVAFASGTSPDIIYHAINSMGVRCSNGQYEQLEKYLADFEGKDDIFASTWELAEYEGIVHGIPFAPGTELGVYRKDFFEEAGLDPEDPPKTWEEFKEAAIKTTIRDGSEITRSGFQILVGSETPMVVLGRQNGGTLLTEDNEPAFNSPEFVEALEFITDLYRKHRVSAERSESQEKQNPAFLEGTSAMSFVKEKHLKAYIDKNPEMKDKIGFFFLKKEKESAWAGCEFLFMSSESNNKDQAWDFIKYASSRENMLEHIKKVGTPTVRRSLAEEYKQLDPWLNSAALHAVKVGNGTTKVPWTRFQNDQMAIAFTKSIYGELSPKEALDEAMQKVLNEIPNIVD